MYAVLLVDDESALRLAVAEFLRAAGHRVLESQSAIGALELARRHSGHIDILLTDVVMPELRGPELARQVKELHPETFVIYMSGYTEGRWTKRFHPKRRSCKNHFVLQP